MNKSRFTIIEILIVISIILLLAGLMFPVVKIVRAKANHAKTMRQMNMIIRVLDEYKEYHGYYPRTCTDEKMPKESLFGQGWKDVPKYGQYTSSTNAQRANVVIGNVIGEGKPGTAWDADDNLVDPYGEPYFYVCPGDMNKSYDLWSKGADMAHGEGGTSSDDARTRAKNDDLTNWKGEFN